MSGVQPATASDASAIKTSETLRIPRVDKAVVPPHALAQTSRILADKSFSLKLNVSRLKGMNGRRRAVGGEACGKEGRTLKGPSNKNWACRETLVIGS
jgi:hypothetical protein